LARYLYQIGKPYQMVPFGLLVGGGLVFIHWVIFKVSHSYSIPPSPPSTDLKPPANESPHSSTPASACPAPNPSPFPKSTSPPSCNSPATSPTTPARPASSSLP
jgi:hypothetical protein